MRGDSSMCSDKYVIFSHHYHEKDEGSANLLYTVSTLR